MHIKYNQTLLITTPKFSALTERERERDTILGLALHSLVEYLEVQYFSISSADLPGILPAIRDHLRDIFVNTILAYPKFRKL